MKGSANRACHPADVCEWPFTLGLMRNATMLAIIAPEEAHINLCVTVNNAVAAEEEGSRMCEGPLRM